MGAGRRTGPGSRRCGSAFGIAAAIAGVLLFALLLAAPLLYLRIRETRGRLDALLRRAHAVRSQEAERHALVRGRLVRQIDEAAHDYDETLHALERGVDRMLPRALSEVRLPEALPLPPDVTPAVAPVGTAPQEEPAVQPAPEKAAAVDPRAAQTASAWAEQLARELGLTAAQQQRAREVMAEYIVATAERAARARQGDKENVYQDIQAARTQAIESIQGFLTAEQSAKYQVFVDTSAKWRATGVVLTPLPGTIRRSR